MGPGALLGAWLGEKAPVAYGSVGFCLGGKGTGPVGLGPLYGNCWALDMGYLFVGSSVPLWGSSLSGVAAAAAAAR